LIPPAGSKVLISSVRLVKEEEVRPTLKVTNAKMSNSGVYNLTGQTADISLRLSSLLPFDQYVIELSKANSFFENCTHGEAREEEGVISKVYKSVPPAPESNGIYTLKIPAKDLSPGVFQEARVRILDKSGATIGEPSAPVNLRLD
jgi:hypothetical protein